LARIVEILGVRHLALDQVELGRRCTRRADAGHHRDTTLYDAQKGEKLIEQLPPPPELEDVAAPRPAPAFPGTNFDVVALASSAGGITAIGHILESLPAGFPAAIVVVQHLDPRHRSLMAEILGRRTPLEVRQAAEGDQLRPGTVHIAPPDRHLLVNRDGSLSLSHSELVHFVRPSADLLFESVAASYQARAIAVVLTGTGSDGSLGVGAIKKMGGTLIVQSQESAEFFGMPGAAIKSGYADLILRLEEIPAALAALVAEGVAR
jgi:two-component system chemotaxis response regulator CheB